MALLIMEYSETLISPLLRCIQFQITNYNPTKLTALHLQFKLNSFYKCWTLQHRYVFCCVVFTYTCQTICEYCIICTLDVFDNWKYITMQSTVWIRELETLQLLRDMFNVFDGIRQLNESDTLYYFDSVCIRWTKQSLHGLFVVSTDLFLFFFSIECENFVSTFSVLLKACIICSMDWIENQMEWHWLMFTSVCIPQK